ncbi:serine hydrolase domain-containing protein [Salegentibacter sediminis]|uniref:serine hydrolase domain-containing protein n=1 Tax=Salegentibacter sediminis TaxID=1930251 RepID=UPI0009BD7A75|nr:serine hydrolase [Salegentibacter sediminis]
MKKFLRILGISLAILLLGLVLLYIFNYEYVLRAARITYLNGHNSAFIADYHAFDNRIIEAADNGQEWPKHPDYNSEEATEALEKINKELKTVSFLMIKNDSIWFEKYYQDYTPAIRSNSFSMAKSIVVAMVGKAIMQGHIESLDQPVADFFPQFDKELKVGDLASMASGLNWEENYYNPFGMTARAYYGNDLKKQILKLKVTETPGEAFKYLSGNTQLLAMVLEKATGENLSDYLSGNFWEPMGMQSNAFWQLDSEKYGMEKAFCCIASNARDFARFGKLFKDKGTWNGQTLLDSSFIERMTQARFEESPEYGYGLWLTNYREKEIFYMRGVHGQYVIVIPEDELVIVRLGEKFIRKDDEKHYPDFFRYIDETYKMLEDAS